MTQVKQQTVEPTPIPDIARAFGGVFRAAIVVSQYNGWITEKLRDGALEVLAREAGELGQATVVEVSGALELPTMAAELGVTGRYGVVVVLGCVIRGETSHDEVINHAIFQQLTRTSAETGVPFGVGVLTVNSPDQAEARAGGKLGNKGAEAMEAALRSAGLIASLRLLHGADETAPDEA
ncbi:MAG: 6,7-dimethyl-8-ribityllumazine synthase [Phycisphaerales bacterium JB065]